MFPFGFGFPVMFASLPVPGNSGRSSREISRELNFSWAGQRYATQDVTFGLASGCHREDLCCEFCDFRKKGNWNSCSLLAPVSKR